MLEGRVECHRFKLKATAQDAVFDSWNRVGTEIMLCCHSEVVMFGTIRPVQRQKKQKPELIDLGTHGHQ